ncbi:MAG TPA: threonine ammonia-lyase [Clostridiales bacterium]|nr:threonine ammonia-lyase [Clostridiales bacterium]
MITIKEIQDARLVLDKVIRKTDLIEATGFSTECDVYIKAENLQRTGSFKIRGAYNKISRLSPEEKARGVVACSAGNHAQGVALGASENGIRSVICLPDGAPISKIEATKHYGAEVELVSGVYDDAYTRALELKEEKGYVFIHPFDDPYVIAGQGTIGLEIMEQLPDADAVIVPIGGGGLISGIAVAVKSINPHCKIYGVQAAGAPGMYEAIKNNDLKALPAVSTIADGIAVKLPGKLTFELCKKYVDRIVTVTDDQISAAALTLLERQKVVSEGAGAASAAAVLYGGLPLAGKKVVCVVSGGNIDVTILSRVISRGLTTMGRSSEITVELDDRPGQLEGVAKIVAEEGANVVSVYHDRTDPESRLNAVYLRLVLETRDTAHRIRIEEALQQAGFKLHDRKNCTIMKKA